MSQADLPFLLSDPMIKDLLQNTKTIALVGASPKPERDSNHIMAFLLSKGYEVIPVNPGLAGSSIHGQEVVGQLADISTPVDIVDVFRASKHVPTVVDDAIAIGAKAVWMQLGVIHEKAAQRAHDAGLKVVMNDCPSPAWRRVGMP